MEDLEFIIYEKKEKAAFITINKEKSLNALNEKVLEELNFCFDQAVKDNPRLLFISGAGEKAFVAGADISEMKEFNSVEATEFADLGNATFKKIESLKFPVVALVDGFTLGGGFELALSCDFILATKKSKFGLPEVSLGLIPGFGGTQRLSRSLGKHLAKALTLTGDMVSADFLYERNLIYKIFENRDELFAEAEKMTKTISLKGPKAVATAKYAIQAGYDLELKDGIDIEKQEFALLFGTKETKEGLSAFLEKRKPEY